ncbi:MAG: alpha/beta hydrolase [Vulcanimicrobiaceae bacterium]
MSRSVKDRSVGNLFMNDLYDDTHHRLDRFLARDHEKIGDLGRSLVYDHGRRTARAALLLHGLSASPTQFGAIAESLFKRGYNVLVPRLPRHGYSDRMSDALAQMTAEGLTTVAAESLAIAHGLGEHVTVVGFSLGGLLAAHLAQHEPVDSVVAVAPFLGIAFVPSILRMPLVRWALRRPNRFHWWDPFLKEKQLPEHGYPRYATHAVAQGLTIAHELFESARSTPPAAARIVLVTNVRETAVNNRAVERLVSVWRKRKPQAVQTHRLENLPFSHDIIEPKRHPELARRVLGKLVELIDR